MTNGLYYFDVPTPEEARHTRDGLESPRFYGLAIRRPVTDELVFRFVMNDHKYAQEVLGRLNYQLRQETAA